MSPSPYTPAALITSEEDVTMHSDISLDANNTFGLAPLETEESSDELFVVSTYTDFSKLGKILVASPFP